MASSIPPRRRRTPHPITVRGARTHNLKGIDVAFPAGKLTVITGVSGSGKSSLAFDTLFAEGQRRYVESLSSYARQFIARLPRPPVDAIDHIPPAIALEQKNSVKNARSTIGTATEINDFLRLIFARIGELHCPRGHGLVRADTPQEVVRAIFDMPEDTRFLLLAPMHLDDAARFGAVVEEMKRQGFTRIVLGGEVVDLDDPAWKAPKKVDAFDVVVDRLIVRESNRTRFADAVPLAFRIGHGRLAIMPVDGERRLFHQDLVCNECGWEGRALEPRLFSFSNPLGACPTCQGFGRVTGLDWNRIIPDDSLSLEDGVLAPLRGEAGSDVLDLLRAIATKNKVRMWTPYKELTEREKEIVRNGKGDWPGITGYFEWLEAKRYKVQARIQIARYRGFTSCPDCDGTRLTEVARQAFVGGETMASLCRKSVLDLREWFENLKLRKADAQTVERALKEVRSRLDYLAEVGLGYLTLDRQTRTLSGGESQRINLATALGSALTETLYVLDEPTVGLHPRDTERLTGILNRLTELGNTVVVVEHDLDVIRRADWLVDMGPGAGERGGRVLFEGPPGKLAGANTESRTARFLAPEAPAKGAKTDGATRAKAPMARWGRRHPRGWITVEGASENNLRHVTAKIPLGVLCVVTGVSGSGKSTLVKSCLWANYQRERGTIDVEPGRIKRLTGTGAIEDMFLVDQEPIGRSARSNAATYLKAYDGIRKLLADSKDGERLKLTPRDFSFNVSGGRCETCEGTGRQVIDMQFLADVEVVCDTCEGRRFQDRVLGVTWSGKNVDEILDLTVEDAIEFFRGYPSILRGLRPLADVGLGYLRLGQATNTLSGGEAQRLKLASHLAEANRAGGKGLLIFDEPTTGLHAADLEVLLGVFDEALDRGFSLLVIEHNLELIRRADWLIDLGPEGGEAGGRIVVEGVPEDVAACRDSLTGHYLRQDAGVRSARK